MRRFTGWIERASPSRRAVLGLVAVAAIAALAVASLVMTGYLGRPNPYRSPTPASSATPVPTLQPAETPSVMTSPTPAASPSPAPVANFGCSLPTLLEGGADGSRARAWLDVDTGAIVRDPSGTEGFYSLAARRWLPVPRNAISPDGLSYAYVEFTPSQDDRLHVITVTTGQDSEYVLTGHWALSVLWYGSDAIFLVFSWEGSAGVWRFDLSTHALTELSGRNHVMTTDGEILWAGSVNPADPRPLIGIEPQANEIDRVVLATGASEAWLYRPHAWVTVRMTDSAGHPVVWVGPGNPDDDFWAPRGQLVLVEAPGRAVTLYEGNWDDLKPGAVDEHGMWIGGKAGVFLLRPGATALEKVSSAAATPAGGCH